MAGKRATKAALPNSKPAAVPTFQKSTIAASPATRWLVAGFSRILTLRSEGRAHPVPAPRSREHRAFLCNVATGQVGPEIHIMDGNYELQLNRGGSATVSTTAEVYGGLEAKWLQSGWGGVVITAVKKYKSGDWENNMGRPILFGPILSHSQDSPWGDVTLEIGDFSDILQHIYLGEDWDASKLYWSRVIWELCKHSTYNPGSFPIRDGSPHRTSQGVKGCGRKYYRHNVDKQSLMDLIDEITALPWGPDFMPAAEWVGENYQSVGWRIKHGSTRHQSASDLPPLFVDARPNRGVAVKVSTVNHALPSRVWVAGSGQGAGRALVSLENHLLTQHSAYWSEEVLTAGNEGDTAGIMFSKAKAVLDSRAGSSYQMVLTVPRSHFEGVEWEVGQEINVNVEGLAFIPDGVFRSRIIKAGASFGSHEIELHLQEVSQVDALEG